MTFGLGLGMLFVGIVALLCEWPNVRAPRNTDVRF